ncbi:S1 RNA-binding domain-containing protein 1 isoform X1 [Pimephales promelas]|uniref:S1 RNA-binding domain-containing protein 1 isoform X1 n=1 Tax=Pimephales promelas TaxID=90988 RepID=UPI001955B930|nr:S1 RNA-binding domain-containing protein 1 isoform X1 [Pimephales promelas]KAG1950854.1 S1 RNA-binding domain-containing protein [Pimephales promelas]
MLRRTRTAKVYKEPETEDDSDDITGNQKDGSEELDEWLPNLNEGKTKGRCQGGTDETTEKKKVSKRVAKPKEPKPKEPKPKAERKPRAPRVPKAKKEKTNTENQTEDAVLPKPESHQHVPIKEERLSINLSREFNNNAGVPRDMLDEGPSSSQHFPKMKKEEPDDSFTFDEPAQKKQKTTNMPQGRPIKLKPGSSCVEDLQMNWDPIQVLANKTGVEQWVCMNIAQLLQEENTIPFMVRYRKELINHMDADAVRDVQLALEELRSVAKKSRSVAQTLKKEGVLTLDLEMVLKNCTTADEIDHVYGPYKKGSKLSKARRAKELGLEPVALALLQAPQTLDLHSSILPNTKGLSTLDEVATGVQEILADMIAKDKETLTHVQSLCDRSNVTIHSSVSKTALKEQQPQQGNQKSKPKDIANFSLYTDFTCDVHRIQHHQTLAINRGENLKILTVKVNIPDWVKNDFCRWCVNVRWRPQGFAQPELMTILKNACEDSYKRFILPFLSRGYRSKLTASAEKESIAMFVRNLRQRLLMCPVRGKVIMGVDPGFHHGCKLAILSPTSQILHTDVVYLHGSAKYKEAEKLRHLMFKHSCQTIVIGNGKACRETEAFFTDLIKRRFFNPIDVSYCITDEAGASIYSVSPEAVKEMPDMDPNLRSAVSIGRRVQDPLAELIKIDPKHIGIGTYQHDVSQSLLRAALDGVVQECVSFVGVDINICSETLMRHIAGLNAGRARNIMEWKEKNGPFLNREQLKLVKGLGPKSFQQCAGFIRINPETIPSICSKGNEDLEVQKQTAKKRKVKGSDSTSGFNPLDQTCIHPESYSIAFRFLSQIGGSLDQMGSAVLRQSVESSVQSSGLDVLAKSLDTTPETLQLIVDGLIQPPGFDIRQDFEQADFKREIVSMNDLHDGMVLTGRVTNTALFGAFVDIGVGRSGLIPNRFITPEKLPVDQRRRSLALGPGERVEVRVMNVDLQRNRISLDLIRVLR